MSWSLIVGGANVTGFVHNGARFREIASSTDGNATFTLNGAHAACVPGAGVTLASGDTLIWEGTIDSANAQYDNSGNVVAAMVHAVPLAAQLDVAGGLSVTQPTDVATVAQALADLTGFPWAGPAEYGIAVGALNISHVGTALTTAATIVRSTWSIRNGALVFNASENITPTPIPASLSGVATAASQVVVRGGLDAITRQPLQGLFIPPGSPTGPVYQTTHASVADSPTLAVLGAAIAERYDQNAQSGSVLLPYTVPIIRAGDFVIDLNEVIAVVHEVIYTLTGGQCTPTITFGFPALPISPVYSAELHDLSVQSPVARLHDGYVVQGGDLTASGLSVSLDTLVAVVNGTSAVVNPAVFTLAPNSTVRINATPAAYVVTDDLTTPAPGSAISLWQVSTNASGVIGQIDLRTHGSIGVANFQSAAYAAPTVTSPSASAVAAVDGVTTDVTISATFTNIPSENTASQIAWYFRTAGTSLWSFWAAEVLPGLPNPAASQTLSFLFAGLQNGGDYDFGAAYVGIRGDAGPISVVESAFATGPLNIPAGDGPPMPSSVKTNGPTVTASSLGSAVGLGSGSYAQPFSVTVGDWTAGANPTWFEELLFFKRQHGDTNAIPVGAISANTTGLTYASTADLPASNLGWDIGVAYLDAAGQTSAIVWPAALNAADAPMNPIYILPGGAAAPAPAISGTPTITPTGVVAGLTDSCALSFALSNQPTDSSLTRIALWLRASGASAWTPYAQVAPVSGGSYALDMTDLTSGTGYDFGVSYVGLGGSESPVTLIGSASASALALKTSYLAQGSGAAPTLSVAASFSTVPSVSGITSDVTVAFTTNNQPADGSFSGLAVYFGTAGGTLGLYAVIPPTGGAYSFTFPALNDGATYAFAIAYVSTNQTSGTELSLGTYAVPALAVPPGAIATGTYAAPTTSSAATDTVEGATSAACDVIVTAPFNNVPASPANGIRWFFRASGTTDWGVSGDTALSATTFKFSGLVNGGTYDFGAAYVGIRHDDVGAITELLASVLASPLAIPGGSLEAMPSAIKTSGPTLSSESVTARVLGIGLVQVLTATFTETDFTATPAWIAKMTLVGRITGTTNTTFERAISPQSSTTGTYSSTPFPMTTGDEIDLGLYYTDLQGNVSATVWPAGWGAISDPNGAYFDGGNSYKTPLHGRMSTGVQTNMNSSGQSLLVEFPGGVIGTDGALTNVNLATSSASFDAVAGDIISVEAMIAKGAATGDSGIAIGSTTNIWSASSQYELKWQGDNNVILYWVKSNGTYGPVWIGPVVTSDTNYHYFRLVITTSAGNTVVEAQFDGASSGVLSDSNLSAWTGTTCCGTQTAGPSGKVKGAHYYRGATPYSTLHPSVRTALNPAGQVVGSVYDGTTALTPANLTATILPTAPSDGSFLQGNTVGNRHILSSAVGGVQLAPARYNTDLTNVNDSATTWDLNGTSEPANTVLANGDTYTYNTGAAASAGGSVTQITYDLPASSSVTLQFSHLKFLSGGNGVPSVFFTGNVASGTISEETTAISGSSTCSVSTNSFDVPRLTDGATVALSDATQEGPSATYPIALDITSINCPTDSYDNTSSLSVNLLNPSGTVVASWTGVTTTGSLSYAPGTAGPTGTYTWDVRAVPASAGTMPANTSSSMDCTFSGTVSYWTTTGGSGSTYVLAADGVTQRTSTSDGNIQFTQLSPNTLAFKVYNSDTAQLAFRIAVAVQGV